MKIGLNWRGHLALILVGVFTLLAVSSLSLSQTATPAPSVAPVISAPASPAPTGLASWIKGTGGLFAAVGVVLGVINIALSALTQIFAKLSIAEPVWMQNLGTWLLKLLQWFSANTTTPAPPASTSG